MTTASSLPDVGAAEVSLANAGSALPAANKPRRLAEYTCECGHLLRVTGDGRHRIYFESGNERLDDPIMDRNCPACGRELPGKR